MYSSFILCSGNHHWGARLGVCTHLESVAGRWSCYAVLCSVQQTSVVKEPRLMCSSACNCILPHEIITDDRLLSDSPKLDPAGILLDIGKHIQAVIHIGLSC